MAILTIIVLLAIGGGGGYYGHLRWGLGGSAAMGLTTISVGLAVAYSLGAFN